jgi:hypothetical protein
VADVAKSWLYADKEIMKTKISATEIIAFNY